MVNNMSTGADGGEGTGAGTATGTGTGTVVFKDGHYYKKDRRDKVSVGNMNKKLDKALGKPSIYDTEQCTMGKPIITFNERSAMGKPNPNDMYIADKAAGKLKGRVDGAAGGIQPKEQMGK